MRARLPLAFALFGAIALVGPRLARADAVGPPPKSCPEGSVPNANHWGPYCSRDSCPVDGCKDGKQCQPVKACVEQVVGSSPLGGPFTFEAVRGPCAFGDKCSVGTCQSWKACVDPGDSSSCSCELGPVPATPEWALALFVGLTLALRRRSHASR
jgi:MYXO-CTERM domain-containing protein